MINFDGIQKILLFGVLPVIAVIIGIVIMGRASGGQWSKVVTTVAIFLIGAGIAVGAITWINFSGGLVNTVVTAPSALPTK